MVRMRGPRMKEQLLTLHHKPRVLVEVSPTSPKAMSAASRE